MATATDGPFPVKTFHAINFSVDRTSDTNTHQIQFLQYTAQSKFKNLFEKILDFMFQK